MASTKDVHIRIIGSLDSSVGKAFQGALAQVRGLNGATSKTSGLFKRVAAGTLAFTAVQKGISAVSSHMGDAISRFDTMSNYPKIMKNLGYETADAQASIQKMSDGIDGLPTSLDEIASSVTKIAPLTKSLDKATDVTLALNNAILAGGKDEATRANALEQYSQMLSVGKVDMQAWKSMMSAMPGQLGQMAEALLGTGHNAMELYDAMKDGTVSFDDFNNMLMKLNKEGLGEYASFAEQAQDATKGIGTSMKNIGTAITKGLTDTIQTVNDTLEKNGYGTIADNLNKVKMLIKKSFSGFNGIVSTVITDVAPYVQRFFGYFKRFSPVADAFKQEISRIGTQARVVFKVLADSISKAFGDVDTATLVDRLAGAIHRAGDAITEFNKFLLKNKDTIAKFASSLPKIIAGFVAFKAIAKVVGPIVAFVKAFRQLRSGESAAKTVTKASKGLSGLTGSGGGLLKTAAAVLMIAAAFGILAQASTAMASASGGLQTFLVMVLSIMALMGVAGMLGPMLTAASPGLLAFGGAMLMIAGAGLIAAAALWVVQAALPGLVAYGASGAGAMLMLGGALIVFGAGAAVAGAGVLILTAGLVGLTVGLTALLVGFAAAAAGVALFAGALKLVSTQMKKIASNAEAAGSSVVQMVAGVSVVKEGLSTLGDLASAGIDKIRNAFTKAQQSLPAAAQSLATSLNTAMATIGSVNTDGSGIAAISAQFAQLGAAVQIGMSLVVSATTSGMAQMSAAVQSGMAMVVAAVTAGMAMFVAVVASGCAQAVGLCRACAAGMRGAFAGLNLYSVGAQAMAGLRAGIAAGGAAAIAQARSIASQISAAMNSALKVNSPSKVTMRTGMSVDEGLIKGMKSMSPDVMSASLKYAVQPVMKATSPTTLSTMGVPNSINPINPYDDVMDITPRVGGAGSSTSVVYSPTINVNGSNLTREDVSQAVSTSYADFERFMKQYQRENRRVALA